MCQSDKSSDNDNSSSNIQIFTHTFNEPISSLLREMSNDADIYAKYRRMLKMGIPQQQVDFAMKMDGLDPSKFVSIEEPSQELPQVDASFLGGLELRGDQYDKYRRMLKAGLPLGAIEQKMKQDGIDPLLLGIPNIKIESVNGIPNKNTEHPSTSTPNGPENTTHSVSIAKPTIPPPSVLRHVVHAPSLPTINEKQQIPASSTLRHVTTKTIQPPVVRPQLQSFFPMLRHRSPPPVPSLAQQKEQKNEEESSSALPLPASVASTKLLIQAASRTRGKQQIPLSVPPEKTKVAESNHSKAELHKNKPASSPNSDSKKVHSPKRNQAAKKLLPQDIHQHQKKFPVTKIPMDTSNSHASNNSELISLLTIQSEKVHRELISQAEKMREELHILAEKVRELPQVKKTLDLYDEQVEKLKQTIVSYIYISVLFFSLISV